MDCILLAVPLQSNKPEEYQFFHRYHLEIHAEILHFPFLFAEHGQDGEVHGSLSTFRRGASRRALRFCQRRNLQLGLFHDFFGRVFLTASSK